VCRLYCILTSTGQDYLLQKSHHKWTPSQKQPSLNPSNAEINHICHLLALLGAHHILHVSRIRVNIQNNTHLVLSLKEIAPNPNNKFASPYISNKYSNIPNAGTKNILNYIMESNFLDSQTKTKEKRHNGGALLKNLYILGLGGTR
jgi:hypothetical protein